MRISLVGILLVLNLVLAAVGCVGDTNSTATNEPATSVQAPAYYEESLRPRVHFTPERGWMNDPNGLVYHQGRYHLFYQYNPDSTVWGPMHWGHAYSSDLVKWEHLPVALAPDELGTIFSGSVVVDTANTSGLGSKEAPAMVALYTSHNHEGEDAGRNDFQTQSLAYSTDGGITWTKYADNPVLPNPGIKDFRDPKITWHPASKRWIMALAAFDRVKFYTSPDLKTWTFASDFGPGRGATSGIWECPDLFPIREYLSSTLRYVLIVSVQDGAPAGGTGTSYFVGDFDGTTFTPTDGDKEPLWLDRGADNYAFVTFSNSPTPENRRLGLGWMSNWQYAQQVPTEGWRSTMTAPRSLTLHDTPDGLRLRAELVPDYFQLRARRLRLNRMSDLVPTDLWTSVNEWGQAAMDVNLNTPDGEVPAFDIALISEAGDTVSVGYDAAAREYYIDRSRLSNTAWSEDFPARHTAPRQDFGKAETLRILIDRNSIELFADDGFTVLTDTYFFSGPRSGMILTGAANITGTIYEMTEAIPTPLSVAKVRLGIED